MRISLAVLVTSALLGPCHSLDWPIHTACKEDGLEVLYQSCDPFQDFGLSIDHCSKQLGSYLNVRFAIILRRDIQELFIDINFFSKGASILSYSLPVCELDFPQFTFCGRRKGEQIYFNGPINIPSIPVIQGEYHVSVTLFNGQQNSIACANFTVISL
ncbi:lymphocyte antigen 86 [Ornithorhynchus anatinus]|uniref:Lymphocyte antigen 86 n=1 Tax=Ornithorhynchus anatinus TaxID=9258 RepID=K7E8L9_ORNAN|nr:lymphocyte antigen 86 [Ornithorhynchus anatinus]